MLEKRNMKSPESIERYGNIFGNGLKMPTSPGVDQDNWKYVAEENNYVYIGEPDKVKRLRAASKQVVNQTTQATTRVA